MLKLIFAPGDALIHIYMSKMLPSPIYDIYIIHAPGLNPASISIVTKTG